MMKSDRVIAEIERVVGPGHVLTKEADVEKAARDTGHRRVLPRAFVYPGDRFEVQSLLRLANETRTPLWVCSRGNNWGYGGATAYQEASIVMVLERLNRILEVNEELAYAVIEPGVSYEQLNAFLKARRFRLWVDCTDGTPKGSVLGNALERGIGETPYGDHFGNLCGLEVVLPTGEVIETGGSADGYLKTWHLHKWGIGPYLEGLFTQSNLGVVTKAGIWLMPEPEAFNSYVLEVRDPAKAGEVIDAFRDLALKGIVTTKLHMINDVVSVVLLTQLRDQGVPPGGRLTEENLARLRRKYALATWSCGGGIYGNKRLINAQKSALRGRLKGLGRLTFVSDRTLPVFERIAAIGRRSKLIRRGLNALGGASVEVLESAPYIHQIMQGVPTERFVNHAYFRHRLERPYRDVEPARDRAGETWFAPILPFRSAEILPYLEDCKRLFAEHGFEFFVAIIMMTPRATVCLMSILHDKEDRDQLAQVDALYNKLVHGLAEYGYQQYRAGVASWETLFERAPGFLAVNDTLKEALDPNHILAPGKYGIGRQGVYKGELI